MPEITHPIFLFPMVVFLIFYVMNWNKQRLLHKKVFNRRLAEIASEYASEQIREFSAQAFYVTNESLFPSSKYIVYVRNAIDQHSVYCVAIDGSMLKPLKMEPYRGCITPGNNIY